jgi:hypothetical protein
VPEVVVFASLAQARVAIEGWKAASPHTGPLLGLAQMPKLDHEDDREYELPRPP